MIALYNICNHICRPIRNLFSNNVSLGPHMYSYKYVNLSELKLLLSHVYGYSLTISSTDHINI